MAQLFSDVIKHAAKLLHLGSVEVFIVNDFHRRACAQRLDLIEPQKAAGQVTVHQVRQRLECHDSRFFERVAAGQCLRFTRGLNGF